MRNIRADSAWNCTSERRPLDYRAFPHYSAGF